MRSMPTPRELLKAAKAAKVAGAREVWRPCDCGRRAKPHFETRAGEKKILA